MSKTTFTTNNALTKKLWDEKLFRDSVKESYFERFMGEGQSSLVQVKNQLLKDKGDRIRFGLRMRLVGDGVTSGQQLEGNEESLTTYDYDVTLEQYRHAVRDEGALSRQRAMFSITDESKMALKDWMSEKIDQLAFDALVASPTKVMYLDSSGVPLVTDTPGTAQSALHATNSKLNLNFISYIKAGAKNGWNRTQIPIRPVKVDGKEYFILLVHNDVMYDLKVSSAWQQAQREAQIRGDQNPLFKGAAGIWDGVVIHEHENIPIANDGGGGSVAWAKCAFMGQQSLCWAWGKRVETKQETFDYGNEIGHAIEMIAGVGKPKFNSKDYGCVGVYLSRTAVSDA